MSHTNPISAPAAHRLPAATLRGLRRKRLLLAAAVPSLIFAWSFPLRTALAVVPPYAEEWSIPSTPEDVEVDPSGRVWVSCGDDSIRVYTPYGGQLLFAFGGHGSGDGQFQTPYGIAFDPSGDAYICDYEGARVLKFTGDGAFLLSWPIPSTRSDHVAVDTAGDVYVTGYTDLSVHKYTPVGDPILSWPSNDGSTTSGVVEAAGSIYVVQWDLSAIEQFATDGTFLGWFDASTLNATDIEVDPASQLWVADYNAHMVRIFLPDGTPVDAFGSAGSGPGEFIGAIGLAIGLDGSVYVADEGNGRIERFGPPATEGLPGLEDAGPRSRGPFVRSVAPNPCRSVTQLTYDLPQEGPVQLAVLDVSGRKVATLAEGRMGAGMHRLEWRARTADGRSLPAGVYLVHLALGSEVDVARLTVVR